MFLAALPWTYWMALPLLGATVLFLVGFGLVYLKKVVEHHILLQDSLAAARAPSLTGKSGQLIAARRPTGHGSPAATISRDAGSMQKAA